MRILIAVHGYPPEHNGGAERRAARTARAMAARGHDVRVFCVASDNASHPELRVSERVQDGIPVARIAFNGGANPDQFRWSYDNPAIGAALRDLMGRWRPDLMQLFGGYLLGARTVDVAADRGVRVVLALTDYWWHCHRINLLTPLGERCAGPSPSGCARCLAEQQRRFRLPAQFFPKLTRHGWMALQPGTVLGDRLGLQAQIDRMERLRTVLARVDVLVAPSQYVADFYVRHGADPARIRVWRQGVELDLCRLRTSDRALRIGYLGQVKPHKGVDLLLDAWSQLRGPRPRRLAIYGSAQGDDRYRQLIEGRVAQLPDVTWHGTLTDSGQIWEALSRMDALVVPSRWVENSPNSILEAQAVGVPIVGSDLGGVAELVRHDGNGLLFRVDDAADLARQLQRLLDEPALLARLRQNVMPFQSHNEAMDRLEQLYRELVPAPIRARAPLALENA